MLSRNVSLCALLGILLSLTPAVSAAGADIVLQAPSGVSATAVSETEVALSWEPAANAKAYAIERSFSPTDGFVRIARVNWKRTSLQNRRLSAATRYYYRVQTLRKKSTPSPYSAVASAMTQGLDETAPSKPGPVTATATNCSQVDLAWAGSRETGSGLAAYLVYRDGVLVATTEATRITDSGLTPLSSWSYSIEAFDNAGNHSLPSDAISGQMQDCFDNVPPVARVLAPSETIDAGEDVTFSGTDSTDDDGAIVSYEWSFGEGGTASGPNVSHVFEVEGTFNVVLSVLDNRGARSNAIASITVVLPPPPTRPSSILATAISFRQVNLTWVDASSNEVGFKIEKSTSATGPFVQFATTGGTSYSDMGVTPSTTYYYRARAYNYGGDSDYTNVVSATTQATLPAAPSNLSATTVSTSHVRLAWTDNANNETGFKVERAPAATGSFVQIATTTGAGFSDSSPIADATGYYRVRAYNAWGNSAYTSIASTSTQATVEIPSAPLGLTATAVSSSSIALQWDDTSSNETGFRIERGSSAQGPFATVATTIESHWTDSGLAPLSLAFYRVSAFNSAGDSMYSNIASATTFDVAPAAPSGLTAVSVSTARIDLVWADNSENETGFRVERAPAATGPFVQIATTTEAGFSDSSPIPDAVNYYRVRAYNAWGSSAYTGIASASTQATVETPSAPLGLTATAVSSSSIALQWDDTSSNETGFRIERGSSAQGPFALVATTVEPHWTDAGLAPLSLAFYRVYAFNSAGDSVPSNIASATTLDEVPTAPSGLSAVSVSTAQIDLTWTDNSDNESGFGVDRASSAGGPWTQVTLTNAGATSWSSTGLNASTTYHFRVRAFNTAGSSAPSGSASATTRAAVTVPDAPADLVATAVSSSRIDLSWSDMSANETGFRIERSATPAGPFSSVATRGAGVVTASDSPLAASTTFYYRVLAFNSAGDSIPSGVASARTTDTSGSDTIAPTVPSRLKVTGPRCGETLLTWDASTDTGGSGLAGYKVYRKNTFLKLVPAPAGATTDTGLPAAAYYYYTVSAIDTAGNESARSAISGSYTQACMGSGGAYRWARGFGGATLPDGGLAVAVDRDGSMFVTGDFQVTAQMGSGSMTSVGYRDVFVTKYAADGTPLWSRSFGGVFDDTGKGIGVDARGDVFVTGVFLRTVDFGGGALTSAGAYDIFLAKYSGLDGDHLWSKRIGGTADDRSSSLAVDLRGDVTITGQFKGAVDFGSGAVPNTNAYAQSFVAKYTGSNGSPVWDRRLGQLTGGATFVSAQSIAADRDGSLVVTGYHRGPVDFGGGPLPTAGTDLDIFLVKYTSAGAHVWSRRFGDDSDQHGQAVAVDSLGNVFLTGQFFTSVDLGSGPLPSSLNTQTLFLAGFASDGRSLWSRSFVAAGLNGASYVSGLAVDEDSNVAITGSIAGPVNLGGGPMPISTIFMAKYTRDGAHTWSKSFRTNGGQGRAIAMGRDGRIAAVGTFDLIADFGGGEIRSVGGAGVDGFAASLEP